MLLVRRSCETRTVVTSDGNTFKDKYTSWSKENAEYAFRVALASLQTCVVRLHMHSNNAMILSFGSREFIVDIRGDSGKPFQGRNLIFRSDDDFHLVPTSFVLFPLDFAAASCSTKTEHSADEPSCAGNARPQF